MCNLTVQVGAGVCDDVGEVVTDGDGEGDGDGERDGEGDGECEDASDAVVGGAGEVPLCDVAACTATGWLSSVLAIANIPAMMPAMTPPTTAKSPVMTGIRISMGWELYQLLIPTVHALFWNIGSRGGSNEIRGQLMPALRSSMWSGSYCPRRAFVLSYSMMSDLSSENRVPKQVDMYADTSGQREKRDLVYMGPLVVGAFAVQAAIAGGVSEALGAETAANTSFAFAAMCALAGLGGAVFAYRSRRGS